MSYSHVTHLYPCVERMNYAGTGILQDSQPVAACRSLWHTVGSWRPAGQPKNTKGVAACQPTE